MWVEKKKNKEGVVTGYKYVQRFKDPLTGKMRKVSLNHIKHNKTIEEEMLLKLNDKIKEILDDPLVTSDISFAKLIDEWLPIHLQTIRGQTKITRTIHSKIFKELFGEVRVSVISAEMLNRYLLSLTKEGLSFSTVKGYRASLSSILKFGKKFGYFKDELWKDLHVEKININKPNPNKYLEEDEAAALLSNLEESGRDELARLCRIQLLTGMRIGELVAIDYNKQIDFEAKTILIDRTYNYDLNSFGPPKSGDTRTIDINQDTIKVIRTQQQYARQKTIRYRTIPSDNTLLFKTRNGRPINPGNINRILKKFHINDKEITTHYFRHTFITMMVANNVPMHLIAEHVGHSDMKMIEEVYKHFNQKMKHELKEAVEKLNYSF